MPHCVSQVHLELIIPLALSPKCKHYRCATHTWLPLSPKCKYYRCAPPYLALERTFSSIFSFSVSSMELRKKIRSYIELNLSAEVCESCPRVHTAVAHSLDRPSESLQAGPPCACAHIRLDAFCSVLHTQSLGQTSQLPIRHKPLPLCSACLTSGDLYYHRNFFSSSQISTNHGINQ